MSTSIGRFNKFLSLPLNTVGEVFLASVLILITLASDIFRTYVTTGILGFSFTELADGTSFFPFILLFIFGILSALFLTIKIFFFKEQPPEKILRLLQWIITPFIFYTWAVYAFYTTPRFIDTLLGGTSLNAIDYALLFYMIIIVVRLCLVFLFLERKRIRIPSSKFIPLNPSLLIIIMIATVIIYFQDTSSLAFALARSFAIGGMILDMVHFLKYENQQVMV